MWWAHNSSSFFSLSANIVDSSWRSYNIFFKILRYTSSENTVEHSFWYLRTNENSLEEEIELKKLSFVIPFLGKSSHQNIKSYFAVHRIALNLSKVLGPTSFRFSIKKRCIVTNYLTRSDWWLVQSPNKMVTGKWLKLRFLTKDRCVIEITFFVIMQYPLYKYV